MTEPRADGDVGDGDRRIEELMRINAELAAEIRSLTLERAGRPRASRVPSTRRVARLIAERDRLDDELRAAEREIARVHEHNAELGRHIDAQARQLERLRAGLAGTLRRLRARLLRR